MDDHSILAGVNRDYLESIRRADQPPGAVRTEVQAMEAALVARRALARGQVLPTFVRPVFVTPAQMAEFSRVVQVMLSVQEKVIQLYFDAPEHRDLYELTEAEKPLVEIPARTARHIYFSRMDTILVEGGSFRFLEFNCDSPGGAYYSDIQTELLMDLSFMRDLAERWEFVDETYRPRVLEALLSAWQSAGRTGKPRIAVMGNPDVANVEEFKLFAEYFAERGYAAFFADPWHCEYDGRTLSAGGRPVDLIYRRGVLKDYSAHVEETRPIIQAYRDGRVLFANPLSAKLGDNKNLLALMTDERFARLFTAEELRIIHEHVPWTRALKPGRTDHKGREVDLLEFVRRERERLVIKPNAEFGGKGVLIGFETSPADWEDALVRCVREHLVVQEYVPIPTLEFPVFKPDLALAPKKMNTNFFTFAGKFGGGFARTSDSSVINISKGGALVAFVTVKGPKSKSTR